MRKEIKEKLTIFLFILMIVVGLGIILYPLISNQLSKMNYQKVIDNYQNTVHQKKNSQNEQFINEARAYNHALTSTNIVDVFQNPKSESSNEYLSILNINNNGMMGYISIPKIDVRIPIYHGTSSDILQKGVGHLEGSSFPVGGENTHAILSAHRGLPSSRLFTDLDQLEEGDVFYIYILDQVFAYQVNQVLVTEPSETDALRIVDGKDYVTLVTCTPYAINTHRLLVRGERIEYNSDTEAQVAVDKSLSTADIILYVSLFVAIVFIIIAIVALIRYKKKKGKNRQEMPNGNSSITSNDSIVDSGTVSNTIISTNNVTSSITNINANTSSTTNINMNMNTYSNTNVNSSNQNVSLGVKEDLLTNNSSGTMVQPSQNDELKQEEDKKNNNNDNRIDVI